MQVSSLENCFKNFCKISIFGHPLSENRPYSWLFRLRLSVGGVWHARDPPPPPLNSTQLFWTQKSDFLCLEYVITYCCCPWVTTHLFFVHHHKYRTYRITLVCYHLIKWSDNVYLKVKIFFEIQVLTRNALGWEQTTHFQQFNVQRNSAYKVLIWPNDLFVQVTLTLNRWPWLNIRKIKPGHYN